MGIGMPRSLIGAVTLALLVAVALCAAMIAGTAGAAKLVGKDGRVYACYKAKGKARGAVRLVPKHAHCKKGSKKISWGVTGPAGESGQSGENGGNGEGGSAGETGATGAKGLEAKVQSLTEKVASLESVLKGITNADLLGMLSKLNGISGSQLQEAVASVVKVNALCTEATALTDQVNAVGESLGGLELVTALLVTLERTVPVPAPLSSFSCP